MRLIDADELSTKVCANTNCCACHNYCNDIDRMDVQFMIEQMPAVDPVKHGCWKHMHPEYKWEYRYYECNVCGYQTKSNSNFCPNCGARMDEEIIDESGIV